MSDLKYETKLNNYDDENEGESGGKEKIPRYTE